MVCVCLKAVNSVSENSSVCKLEWKEEMWQIKITQNFFVSALC